ncbi:hypothetical protein HY480_01620 [Candidatus Uhrbacteria bacterium]|nr:hypothetical protein [Candidatus Uhrbacteria bacterium]
MDARAILAWFDLFDWVLTPAEYAAFGVGVPAGTAMVDGFVVAPGRKGLAWVRRRKAVWAWRKLRKARQWARVLALVPFVRMIAIGNDLGYGNCRDESDIDLVIVTAPHRVWLVRLCIGGLLKLLHQRPGEHARDALCPSFFLTTEAMDLEDLQIGQQGMAAAGRQGSAIDDSQLATRPTSLKLRRTSNSQLPPDPYLLWWATQLTVLSDRDSTYAAFWRANERWVRRWLPDAWPRAIHPRISVGASPPQPPLPKGGGEIEAVALLPNRGGVRWGFGDVLETWSRRFQERRLSLRVRALMNTDSCVVMNDHMIKLHTNDRRQAYCDRWLAALAGSRV